MKEHKKGIKLPLYAAILGLVVLALIIIVVVFHNLSSDRSPKMTGSSSKKLVSIDDQIGKWAETYTAGNTTWSTNIVIKKDGTYVRHDTAGEDNLLVNQGLELAETSGKITKGKVEVSSKPFANVKYVYEIPNNRVSNESSATDKSTAVKPVVYFKLTNASVSTNQGDGRVKVEENHDVTYLFGIEGTYEYSYSIARGSTNERALVSNLGEMVFNRYKLSQNFDMPVKELVMPDCRDLTESETADKIQNVLPYHRNFLFYDQEGKQSNAETAGDLPLDYVYNLTTQKRVNAGESFLSTDVLAIYTAKKPLVKMNLSEIAQGNYESIQGTWLNESGNTIIVSGNTMSISDFTATKNAMSAKVDGLSIDIPSLNDSATGAPKKTSGQSTDDKAKDFNPFAGQAEYDKNLKVSESVQTAGVLEFGTTLVSSGIYFGFAPENVSVISGGADVTDDTKARIFVNGGQNGVVFSKPYYLQGE